MYKEAWEPIYDNVADDDLYAYIDGMYSASDILREVVKSHESPEVFSVGAIKKDYAEYLALQIAENGKDFEFEGEKYIWMD